MGGNTLGDQMLVNATDDLNAVVNQGQQVADQAREKLSLSGQMLQGAIPQDASSAQSEEMSGFERYGTVFGKGILRTPEGVLNTVGHYWNNPGEAGAKALFAGSIGVAMRTFLPKTGAGRAAVATIMGGMFVVDGIKAFAQGGAEASNAKNRQELNQAATNFGNHMGMFAFDAAAGGYIGIKAERLTGKVLENPIGTAKTVGGWADNVVGRFSKTAPAAETGEAAAAANTYANRMGAWVEGKELAPKFAAWDKKVERFWTSDESKVGNFLNRSVEKIDGWTAKFKPKEEPVARNPLENIPPERVKALMEQAQRQHIEAVDSHMVYRHGLKGADGEYHGFDRTLALLKKGINPEQIGAKDPIPNVPDLVNVKLDEALAGMVKAREQVMNINDAMTKIADDHAGHQFKKQEGGTTVQPHEQPGTKPYDKTPQQAAADGEINVKNLQDMAVVTADERAAITAEDTAVIAYKQQMEGQVYTAVQPNSVRTPLGPEHNPAANTMFALGKEVNTAKDVAQVDDLFRFFADAATQSQAGGLGPNQALAKQLNLVGDEFFTFLVASMKEAGIKDPFTILQGKTPPLFAVSSDLVRTPDGKTVNAGPYTMRRIITEDPKTGEKVTVWGPDLVKYPINMTGERATSIGVYGHEIGHDWNGLIAKFLDKSGEGGVLTKAVEKALGPKYNEVATIISPEGVPKELLVNKEKWTNGRLIESYLRATRDENTSDIIGTAWTGINMPVALARLLMGGRRNGGLMENSNVFSPTKMATPDNPMGFEVHAIDALRMVIGAKTMEYLGKGDPVIEAQAKSLLRLSREGSTKGDYELYNLDKPGQKVVIDRDTMDNVISELITAQMETPLTVLEGKTFSNILPPLKSNYAKMEGLGEAMAKAITEGKKVQDLVGDPKQFTQDYTITQVFGSGLPAELKLIKAGMDPKKAHATVREFSDHMRQLYLETGDPHVHSLIGANGPVELLPSLKARASALRDSFQNGAINLVGRQNEMRWWANRNSTPIVAGTSTAMLPDGDMNLSQRLKTRMNSAELMAAEQQRQALLQQQQGR
ncbi:MAG TPA: hypothetical protein EYN91_04205 [Candidatus Melainabacteria bacterium]|nr:hypothetical protein [Candidatus Melainabacteria bacterium]